jgi:hypothetical protein
MTELANDHSFSLIVPVCDGLWYYKGLLYHLAKVNHGTPYDISTFPYAPTASGLGVISDLI